MTFYNDSFLIHTQLGQVKTLNRLPMVVVATAVPFSFTQQVFQLAASQQFQQGDATLNQASVYLMALLKFKQMFFFSLTWNTSMFKS